MNPHNIANVPSTESERIDSMVGGAQNALKFVLSLKEDDKVLIITDRNKEGIGKAFEYGARKLGCSVHSYCLADYQRPLAKIPEDLRSLLEGCKVFVNAFSSYAEETPFRIQLTQLQRSFGARVGHAPGITEDMMVKGPMTADYEKIAVHAQSLIKALKGASKVHITTHEGTDIVLNIKDRAFETDAWVEPGNMGNLPAGEIWCAPVENDACGTILVNGAIGDVDELSKTLKITVLDGKIKSLESEDSALVTRIRELISLDEMASVIGELGCGLNPKARFTGNLLEDEKAGGTAHIAFGHNEEMPGGKNNSKTHRDFLFYNPTFEVEFEDGSKQIVIKDGTVVV